MSAVMTSTVSDMQNCVMWKYNKGTYYTAEFNDVSIIAYPK
jgi:hypothetical protein